ncbi:MAG: hypothetical protein LWW81_13870 [Rhodocyclales bacterium]|nr:hypothetical protein [Rhodocyclales bacterium]
MTRRKVADRGDIIAIPTVDGREVFAQVCWASDYFKDVIQIPFVACSSESELHEKLNFIEPSIFSGATLVRKNRWRKLFTHTQLYEPSPPIFYSGGGVYKGDEYIREATADERSTLLNLSVKGYVLVEKLATEVANQIHLRGAGA